MKRFFKIPTVPPELSFKGESNLSNKEILSRLQSLTLDKRPFFKPPRSNKPIFIGTVCEDGFSINLYRDVIGQLIPASYRFHFTIINGEVSQDGSAIIHITLKYKKELQEGVFLLFKFLNIFKFYGLFIAPLLIAFGFVVDQPYDNFQTDIGFLLIFYLVVFGICPIIFFRFPMFIAFWRLHRSRLLLEQLFETSFERIP